MTNASHHSPSGRPGPVREVAAGTAGQVPGAGGILIDVREGYEFDAGHIPGAIHVSLVELEVTIGDHVPDRSTPIVLYCAAGVRSRVAAETLGIMGYDRVSSVAGGFQAWCRRDQQPGGTAGPSSPGLSSAQRERYARHLALPEVGEAGQRRLLDARVLIIGVGGLGSAAALYLAAAGVGTLGIIDADRVETGNLQRQILHSEDRVGAPKVGSAAVALTALNAEVAVEPHDETLTAANAPGLFGRYDVVVNGCDNFPTRYLANDVAVLTGTPLVDGSVVGFEGEVATLVPPDSPCYRCRYPSPPPPGASPSCAQAGVLGVLPGIVGTIQAAEVLKLLLRRGRPLTGRVLRIDGLSMTFREFTVLRDPACPVCGDRPTIHAPIDYERFCGHAPGRVR